MTVLVVVVRPRLERSGEDYSGWLQCWWLPGFDAQLTVVVVRPDLMLPCDLDGVGLGGAFGVVQRLDSGVP